MHLMHDWWSAFTLIANRVASRISRGGWTVKSLRPYSLGGPLEILNYQKIHFFGQGYDTSLHVPSDTMTESPPQRRSAHCKVTLERLMVTNTSVEGS